MGKIALRKIFLVDHESKLTRGVIRKLVMDCDEKIEAILTLNGITAMVVLRSLRSLGIQVGKNIARISFDDLDLAEILTPGLTAIRQSAAELGRRAAKLFFTRMEGVTPLPPSKYRSLSDGSCSWFLRMSRLAFCIRCMALE